MFFAYYLISSFKDLFNSETNVKFVEALAYSACPYAYLQYSELINSTLLHAIQLSFNPS
jgi:hypothetical protein